MHWGHRFTISFGNINHLMYMDDTDLFEKSEKELETLIQIIRKYNQNIEIKFGLENVQCS